MALPGFLDKPFISVSVDLALEVAPRLGGVKLELMVSDAAA